MLRLTQPAMFVPVRVEIVIERSSNESVQAMTRHIGVSPTFSIGLG
jgi:hypothetical protein